MTVAMGAKRNSIKNITLIALATGLILLIPLLGDWPWTLSDFVIMGALLFGTRLTYELIARRLRNTKKRVILGIVLAVAFLLIWVELAVGLFGTPFAGS